MISVYCIYTHCCGKLFLVVSTNEIQKIFQLVLRKNYAIHQPAEIYRSLTWDFQKQNGKVFKDLITILDTNFFLLPSRCLVPNIYYLLIYILYNISIQFLQWVCKNLTCLMFSTNWKWYHMSIRCCLNYIFIMQLHIIRNSSYAIFAKLLLSIKTTENKFTITINQLLILHNLFNLRD